MEVHNETNYTGQLWDLQGKVPFVDKWTLMGSPVPILLILLGYLIVVLKVGPEFMRSRPPMGLNKVLMAYNAIQVLFSIYLFTIGLRLLLPYGLIHKTCLLNNEDFMQLITTGIYYYLIAKISELLDTVFFILRKKQNQLTFLHVYHHFSMVFCTWVSLKYEPTHSVIFLGTINSFIHIIMYAYYGLAAYPSLAKYLWWKKYITSMQLIQFVMIFFHAILNYIFGACPPSYFLFTVIVFNTIFFVFLFGDFYIKSYNNKGSTDTIKCSKSSIEAVNGTKQKAN